MTHDTEMIAVHLHPAPIASTENREELTTGILNIKGEVYLTDPDSVVQHRFGVCAVVAAGQLGPAEVGLQQQVGLCMSAVKRMGVDLQGELLCQLAVQLVLVVSHWQLSVLLCILRQPHER